MPIGHLAKGGRSNSFPKVTGYSPLAHGRPTPRPCSANLAGVSRHELLYRGTMRLDGGDEQQVEVWAAGSTLVAFSGGHEVGVMWERELSMTDDGRLVLTGQSRQDREPIVWEAVDVPTVGTRWTRTTVRWPDEPAWQQAFVEATQHGVTVSVAGQDARRLAGYRVEMVGARRWLVGPDGQRVAADAARRPCNCGG